MSLRMPIPRKTREACNRKKTLLSPGLQDVSKTALIQDTMATSRFAKILGTAPGGLRRTVNIVGTIGSEGAWKMLSDEVKEAFERSS
jgi:hypothetical protein